MPISKSESRRKRRSCENNNGDSLSDSPKRTKVHAQRKFAQGAALIPPIITHLKEIEKEKSKPNDTEPVDLLPSKRPNTEDFLTFLCFRGTNILPPSLDFFHSSASHSKSNKSTHRNEVTRKRADNNSSAENRNSSVDRPFIAFGVRKRADPFIHKRIDRKRRHVLTVQPIHSKIQKQRIAKLRAANVTKRNIGDSFIKTRSASKTQQKTKKTSPVKSKTSPPSTKKPSVAVKRKMKLRNTSKILKPVKKGSTKQTHSLKSSVANKKNDTSSEFSSDDNQPLLKSVRVVKKVPKQLKKSAVTLVTTKSTKKLIARTGRTSVSTRSTRSTRSTSLSQPTKLSQRPSRRTKEAAALYMEMLGRKLSILENEPDDETMSIDSFPELPNVKRAVQRENEIKAQISNVNQIKTRGSVNNKNKVNLVRKVISKPSINKATTSSSPILSTKKTRTSHPLKNLRKVTTTSQKSLVVSTVKKDANESTETLEDHGRPKRLIKKPVDRIEPRMTLRKTIFRNKVTTKKSLHLIKNTARNVTIKKQHLPRKPRNELVVKTAVSPDLSTSPKIPIKDDTIKKDLEIKPKDKKITKIAQTAPPIVRSNVKTLNDQIDFSDSDEEPLACKIKSDNTELNIKDIVPVAKDVPDVPATVPDVHETSVKNNLLEKEQPEPKIVHVPEKVNTEVKKVEVKANELSEPKELEQVVTCQQVVTTEHENTETEHTLKSLQISENKEKTAVDSTLSSIKKEPEKLNPQQDLLCKDVGRHFGKGKVNMSAEQIEKWLNDADQELKKESIKKSDSVEVLFKLDEKPTHTNINECETKLPIIHSPVDDNKIIFNPEKRTIFQQRRPIINKTKERKDKTPSTAAFSPDNESSVYAFEAESEIPVNTPFRRHCRRPSSTTTSKSEDEIVKFSSEDESKKTPTIFRIPPVLKQDIKNISSQPLSLTLNPDNNPNQCTSIAVQVDLTDNVNKEIGISSDLECTTATEMADDSDGHLFYIPLQTGKQFPSSDQQVIQGVAVKLGTTGSSGSNQRVIMQAKLVTKSANTTQAAPFTNKSLLPTQNRPTTIYPPIGTVQPFRSTKPSEAVVKPMPKSETKLTNYSDDIKINEYNKLASYPSASSSNTQLNRRVFKMRPRLGILDSPSSAVVSSFPSQMGPAQVVEAPTFHPTEKEFQDPLEFIDKIRPLAESFGLCRIVPPQGFKPECKVSDDMRFTAYNQYVHKMLYRWGPNFRELTAIKKYLATQNITLNQAPWIGGMEVDLPRLYQTVQSLGGLKEVIEKKKWPRVAEIMRIPKSAQDRLTKLDDIYCKYLLPYDTLSTEERQKLLNEVDTDWEKQQKKVNSQSSTNFKDKDDNDVSSEADSDDGEDAECIVRGRSMALSTFYRIARNTMAMWFKTNEPSVSEVENEFWKHVNMRVNHLCVHSGSIDSGGYGYGFVCSKNSPFARHPWNLKVLTNNPSSILRSMGPIMGVTVPTLHVGMVFSACCWYRDPHGLPWIEYLHTGANKVWYGIPDSLNELFRQTLNKLVPNVCRKTPVWLPSDTAMIPPSLLVNNNVSLCRTVQEPGQYIVIFPKAFTSSLCTGYTVSESVFFAQPSWLENSEDIFSELKESCEPSMFSLERLLLSMALDTRCTVDILKRILPGIQNIRDKESIGRDKLRQLGVTVSERLPQSKRKKKKADTDGEYLCEVCKSNLYVSLVTDIQDDEVFCLQHAAENIATNKISTKDCKLMYTYTEDELCEIVDKVINAIDTKYQKKSRPNL